MSKQLDEFIQALDQDHAKAAGLWKKREKGRNMMLLIFSLVFAFSMASWLAKLTNNFAFFWVTIIIGGIAVALLRECEVPCYGWSKTLVEAGKCLEYETLRRRNPAQAHATPKNRPLYVADLDRFLLDCDAATSRIFNSAKKDAAARLRQGA